MDKNKIIFWLVLILLVTAGIVWLSKVKIERQLTAPGIPESTPINSIETYDLQTGQLPREWLADVPIENDAKITNSYNATSPDGKRQATVIFDSAKSVTVNFTLYKNYLDKNKWQILAQDSSRPEIQLLVGRHPDGEVLNVTIRKTTTGSSVDLSILP